MNELEQRIRSHPLLDSTPSATGFYQLVCPACNDYKKRAGFRFENNKIVYSCFRGKCDASTEYVYGEPMYKKFRYLMHVMGIDIPVEYSLLKTKKKKVTIDGNLYEPHYFKQVSLPDGCVEYNSEEHIQISEWIEERKVSFNVPLYVGRFGTAKNKLIVPFIFNRMIIGYQLIWKQDNQYCYQTSSGNTDLVFINDSNGYIHQHALVSEGVMDAACFKGGVAVLGNGVSKKQAFLFMNSNPILIPDRKDSRFLDVAKRYKWRLCVPEWKEKDINDAIKRYGKFIVARMIHDGILVDSLEMEVKYKMWSKR